MGSARLDSSHSRMDIRASARNSASETLPSTETARSNTVYLPAAARPLRSTTPTNSTQTNAGSSRKVPASARAMCWPTSRQTEISARVSISAGAVIRRTSAGCSNRVGASCVPASPPFTRTLVSKWRATGPPITPPSTRPNVADAMAISLAPASW